jgi:hypothetical protein
MTYAGTFVLHFGHLNVHDKPEKLQLSRETLGNYPSQLKLILKPNKNKPNQHIHEIINYLTFASTFY